MLEQILLRSTNFYLNNIRSESQDCKGKVNSILENNPIRFNERMKL